MAGLATTGVIAAALAALWIGVAVALSLLAARRFRLAERVLGAAQANTTLLEISPARPLIVRGDGRVEADRTLVRELGLKSAPSTLSELHGNDSGLLAEDVAKLTGQIETARSSAARLAAKVRVAGSSRVLEVRGGPAPPPELDGDGDGGEALDDRRELVELVVARIERRGQLQ